MGAFAYTKAVRDVLIPGAHGSTFGGSPLACAAGLAALEAYRDENLIKRSATLGANLRNQLRGALEGVATVREIRGVGLMIGVELRTKVAPVLKSLMMNHGVIALPAGPTVLRLLPPLVITEKEIDFGVQAIARAIKDASAGASGTSKARWIALPRLNWCTGWWRSPRCRGRKSSPQRGSSARCAPPASIARSWMTPATRSASWAMPIAPRTIVLLGHIDTVPGNIPVRIENDLLYGRGSVDAKGPLATFVAGAARFGSAAAKAANSGSSSSAPSKKKRPPAKALASSRPASTARREPIPDACIIGEPSHWNRVTLGYKGRLLLDLTADQPMAHTAGPDASVASVVVDLWNWVTAHAARVNAGKDKVFDQLSPSLRRFITATNGEMHDTVDAQFAWRLPVGFDAEAFMKEIEALAGTGVKARLRLQVPRL